MSEGTDAVVKIEDTERVHKMPDNGVDMSKDDEGIDDVRILVNVKKGFQVRSLVFDVEP